MENNVLFDFIPFEIWWTRSSISGKQTMIVHTNIAEIAPKQTLIGREKIHVPPNGSPTVWGNNNETRRCRGNVSSTHNIALTLEENERLPLHVRGVRNFQFAVQSGLRGNVVVVDQNADDHLVRSVLHAFNVVTAVGQRVAPANELKPTQWVSSIRKWNMEIPISSTFHAKREKCSRINVDISAWKRSVEKFTVQEMCECAYSEWILAKSHWDYYVVSGE